MNCVNLLKLTITATSFAIGTVGFTTTANAAYNLCQIDTVPKSVIKRIIRRSVIKRTIRRPDFDEILERMLVECPVAALSLTEAATAAVAGGSDEGPNGRDGGGEGSGDGGNGDGPGNGGDDSDGGDDGGHGDDGDDGGHGGHGDDGDDGGHGDDGGDDGDDGDDGGDKGGKGGKGGGKK